LNKRILLTLVGATTLLAACAGTGGAPATTTARPQSDNRFLIDPRIGESHPADPSLDRRFDAAWRFFLAGDYVEAHRRLAAIRSKNPGYAPAALADAAVEIKQGQLDSARAIVQHAEEQAPDSVAARVYEAEIVFAEHRTRAAFDIYRALAQRPDAPTTVAERLATLQSREFEELFAAAQGTNDEEAIRLLREALTLNAGASNARILLANRLIARKSYDEARQVLEPLVNSAEADKPEVQGALAEIEVGRGQYEQAIARYDRLARITRDPRYVRRLDEVKQEWSAANMPPQYQRAIESESIDRADLAVLTYWKVTSIRFAQNLGTPPIAIDIEGVPGREEIIRAIATGLYDVDPVTRRVSPLRTINASTLERLAGKLLLIRGASCARSVPYERDESLRAQKILAACAVNDPIANEPEDAPVSGKTAAAMLDDVETALGH
jgi:thioredoxin-like negative regulator of GroEL